MDILFKEETIGQIKDIYYEDLWIHGKFVAENSYYKYKEFLDALVCEDGFDEMKFEKELLNDNNWYIKNNGDIKEIWIPAIYDDGDISLRYK